jgi:hypothetical protein
VNWSQAVNTFVQLLPVIFLVNGLTTAAGMFGVQGKAQLATALGLGVLAGGVGWLAVVGLPAAWTEYFWAGVAGLLIGTISVLFYEMIKGVFERAIKAAFERIEGDIVPGQ